MSTRTNIQIFNNDELIVSLYRHMDGYPAETGADLVEKAISAIYPDRLAAALLKSKYEDDRPIYQVSGIHGDIEHFYRVIFSSGNKPTITIEHAERTTWSQEVDEWIENRKTYTMEGFIKFVVNPQRKEINRRREDLKKQYPNMEHGDPYQMIGE